jgi:DNA-directed RNA polymerase subunit RPC12/RpoP
MMYQANDCLVLHPIDRLLTISQQDLIAFAKEKGLIGEAETESRFQVGERFLSLLCFMGCSPNIELYPQSDGSAYCYIEIPEPTDKVLVSQRPKVPRCPACKQTLTVLTERLNNQALSDTKCPDCGSVIQPETLNWRKTAVFSPSRIIINNIYDAEAVPDGNLLAQLNKHFGSEWRYAYIKKA